MASPLVVVIGRYYRYSFWVLSIFLLNACGAQVTTESEMRDSEASPVYTQRNPSWDGIGKIYMGREIARVMSHERSSWLDRPSREKEELPEFSPRCWKSSKRRSKKPMPGTSYRSLAV
jgi:hypothetical protein